MDVPLQDDIRTDRRGKGPAFLRAHPVMDGELVLSPYVYHSRASAIEGQFQLFHSRAAWLEAGGAGDGKDGGAAGGDDAANSGGSGSFGTAAPSSSGGGSRASPADAEPDGMPSSFFCEQGWDRVTGLPWEFDDEKWFRRFSS